MRPPSRLFSTVALLAPAALLVPGVSLAAVPLGLTEQGRLFDAGGDPLNATISLTFSIYASASGGTALWTETQAGVVLDQGYFSAALGGVTPIPQSIWTGGVLYVGVAVNADPEMSPRQPTYSVPYALVTNDAVGDIHPTTVSVNGSLVIDQHGNWVGPTTGLAGPAGATGAQGPAGPAGATGAQGPAGPAGATGAQGPAGANGPDGAQGPPGPQGAQGPAGANGSDGAQGPSGAGGATGATGADGATGATGPTGPTGPTGAVGPAGPMGPQGTLGATGATGAAGAQGSQGATGASGADGTPGAQGAAGANGAQGPQGPAGTDGTSGATGADGATGPTGATGAVGPMGPAGPTGPTGAQGATGAAGTNGATGAVGPMGPVGPTGPTGAQGATGAAGTNGANGAQGAAGAAGSNGAQGAAGTNGTSGAQGAAGSNGAQGAAGTNGTSGAQGAAGLQGPAGSSSTGGAYVFSGGENIDVTAPLYLPVALPSSTTNVTSATLTMWAEPFRGQGSQTVSFTDATSAAFNLGTLSNVAVSGNAVSLTASTSFLSGWTYRQPYTITSAAALTDFQVFITVNRPAQMLSTYADMRFTDASGTNVLPYWIETSNASQATVVVRVPSLAAGATTLYMYYGNASAPAVSSGSATYLYFDDGTLGGWTVANGGAGNVGNPNAGFGNPAPSYSVNSGPDGVLQKSLSGVIGPNVTIEADNYFSSTLDDLGFMQNATGLGQFARMGTNTYPCGIANTNSFGSWSGPSGGTGVTAATWHQVRIDIGGTAAQMYVDGSAQGVSYTFNDDGSYLALIGDGASGTGYWDNIHVRRFAASAPTATAGTGFGATSPTGTFSSQVRDTGVVGAPFSSESWSASTPTNTAVSLYARASDNLFTETASSPAWEAVPASGFDPDISGRYIQYQAVLTTSDGLNTPTLGSVTMASLAAPALSLGTLPAGVTVTLGGTPITLTQPNPTSPLQSIAAGIDVTSALNASLSGGQAFFTTTTTRIGRIDWSLLITP